MAVLQQILLAMRASSAAARYVSTGKTSLINQTSWSFNSQSIKSGSGSPASGGSATPNKLFIFVHMYTGAGTVGVTGVTVDGVGASSVLASGSGASTSGMALYVIDHPGGSTANIVVTSATQNYLGITIFEAFDVGSSTPVDTATQLANTNPHTCTIDLPGNGFIISGFSQWGNSLSYSWSNATEGADEKNTSPNEVWLTNAVNNNSSSATTSNLNVSVTYTGTNSGVNQCQIAAAFR